MSSFSQPADSLPAADARPASPAPAARLSRAETAIVLLALVVLGILRWFSVYSHQWNSDEPQHLHVVWAWTVGKLQYRDIFDNHTPLFHILNAPLLRWLGERADIVLPMRRAMIPLFAAGVWSVYRLGATLYDRRTGWLAALLAAFFPAFFFRMGEFRTDVMWTTLWLLVLVVALTGKLTPWRTFSAALLLGATFSVSMKTTLLVFCLAVAGILTWLLAGRPIAKAWPGHVVAFLGGVLLVPGIIVGYFAMQGALQPLYHCVIAHNTLPGQHLGHMIGRQILSRSSLWVIPVGIVAARMLPGARQEPGRGYRRIFLFLLTGLFYSLLRAFWPVVTTQDYLPWLPLLPILVITGWTWLRGFAPGNFRRFLPWLLLPVLLLVGETAWIIQAEPPWKKVEANGIENLDALLHLTDPGEFVFDLKGETIFRPRPTYLVFESLTRKQIELGALPDDTIPRLIATRTAMVQVSKLMMPKTLRFIEQNYVKVDGGRVLGQRLSAVHGTPLTFEIAIPERYALIAAGGAVTGTLDGTPIDGPRQLEAGRHQLVVEHAVGAPVLVWARALERGFSPYLKLEAPTPE